MRAATVSLSTAQSPPAARRSTAGSPTARSRRRCDSGHAPSLGAGPTWIAGRNLAPPRTTEPRRAPGPGRAQPGASAPLTRRAAQPRSGSRAGGCSAPCPASPSGGEDHLVTLAQRSIIGSICAARLVSAWCGRHRASFLCPAPSRQLALRLLLWRLVSHARQVPRVLDDRLRELAVLGIGRRSKRLGDFAPGLRRIAARACQLDRRLLALARCRGRALRPGPCVATAARCAGCRRA